MLLSIRLKKHPNKEPGSPAYLQNRHLHIFWQRPAFTSSEFNPQEKKQSFTAGLSCYLYSYLSNWCTICGNSQDPQLVRFIRFIRLKKYIILLFEIRKFTIQKQQNSTEVNLKRLWKMCKDLNHGPCSTFTAQSQWAESWTVLAPPLCFGARTGPRDRQVPQHRSPLVHAL